MKRAVLIIAQQNFRDEEFLKPKAILEDAGVEVKVASLSLDIAKGTLGAKVKPDMLVSDIKTDDLDILLFVGGSGAAQYWDDPTAQDLARKALEANKVVAAICIAPVTLARAGILKGKKATVFPSGAEDLKAAGADYTAMPVERDGNIITANGPQSAEEFAREILKVINAIK